ncbi:MAG: hypothetical protein RM021_003265 [Nostoc sp. EkiNYC01]|nr:hypothetical protein [Nostoc sp. EkiNYC01]
MVTPLDDDVCIVNFQGDVETQNNTDKPYLPVHVRVSTFQQH